MKQLLYKGTPEHIYWHEKRDTAGIVNSTSGSKYIQNQPNSLRVSVKQLAREDEDTVSATVPALWIPAAWGRRGTFPHQQFPHKILQLNGHSVQFLLRIRLLNRLVQGCVRCRAMFKNTVPMTLCYSNAWCTTKHCMVIFCLEIWDPGTNVEANWHHPAQTLLTTQACALTALARQRSLCSTMCAATQNKYI